jgi:ubiquinone/menaquinone biosynthesis C-methylase UbiE
MTEAVYLDQIRTAYDLVAADYEELLRDSLAEAPLDRAMLGTFAELVRAAGGKRVLEVGCGPGRITTYLDSLGLDVSGVDLSPRMIEVAQARLPHLRFDVGSMTALDLPDESFDGLVAWFSIIHLPTELMPTVFAEFRRVLRPGGQVALTFQAGEERVRIDNAYGHDIEIDLYKRTPEVVAELLEGAGLEVRIRVHKEPEGPNQKSPQSILLATKITL